MKNRKEKREKIVRAKKKEEKEEQKKIWESRKTQNKGKEKNNRKDIKRK